MKLASLRSRARLGYVGAGILLLMSLALVASAFKGG